MKHSYTCKYLTTTQTLRFFETSHWVSMVKEWRVIPILGSATPMGLSLFL